jgi:hypothetical protein
MEWENSKISTARIAPNVSKKTTPTIKKGKQMCTMWLEHSLGSIMQIPIHQKCN